MEVARRPASGWRLAVALVVTTIAAVAAGESGAPPAAAQGAASRQSAELRFTQQRPGEVTGANLSIDFRNPENPGGKPHAVARMVFRFHEGTRFNTAALPRCEASDLELMAQGAAACPPASLLATGTLLTDTGAIGGLPREVTNKLAQFNGRGESITLAESETNPPTRVVSRARIDGNVVVTEVPPVPGGPPPDPYTAFKHFELTGVPAANRAPYLRTPPACPASGHWTNRLTFTYRDGVSETVESHSPCRALAGKPRVRIKGVRREGCAQRGFFARARIRSAEELRRARLSIDGRVVRTTAKRRFAKWVHVKQLDPGRHRVRVVARAAAGRASRTASFRTCAHG